MPAYNEEFKTQVLEIVSNLKGAGQLYRRKLHTLEMITNTYKKDMLEQHKVMGANILEKLGDYITHIMTHTNDASTYEHLEFVNSVIKWYFKLLGRRKNAQGQLPSVALPDYTIPEIKEIYSSISKM